jgi:reductive dehalogenase
MILVVYPLIYSNFLSYFIVFFQATALIFLVIIFFYRLPQTRGIKIKESEQNRFDERDSIFSRMKFVEGSEDYNEYYKNRQELKETDHKLRKMPHLSHPETDAYDPLISPMMFAEFAITDKLIPDEPKIDNKKEKQNYDLYKMTEWLKQTVLDSGATCCGVTRVDEAYLYSYKGYSGGISPFGSSILKEYEYALVFAVEMDHFQMQKSPKAPIVVETARQYVNSARIGLVLANYINYMGFKARVEMVKSYHSILPALAYQAGLGELGRIGILMTKKHGPRVRLGAVLTDMPLACDAPINLGMQHFCEICTKCANCCPSKAIPKGEKVWIRGIHKWQINPEKCFTYWRKLGTDCGICMTICPYSKPDSFIHNIVRYSAERSYLSRSLWSFADNLFYGKNPQKKVLKSIYSNRNTNNLDEV